MGNTYGDQIELMRIQAQAQTTQAKQLAAIPPVGMPYAQAATAGQGTQVRVRFCTDCKWVERGWTGRMKRTPKCLHPEVATTDRSRYFLDGTKRVSARPYAEACREGSCGSEGRFYEARSEAQAALEALGG